MRIPLLDLQAQYQGIKGEIDAAVQKVLAACDFIMGEDVKKLEEEIASYLRCSYGIGVASGTDALLLALLACGLSENDEIITTPFTFIATTEAVSRIRARIVFADVDEYTFNLDPAQVKKKITDRTRAILPVHLYGQPADMDPLMKLAGQQGLSIIEDCAQALGAEYKKKKIGSLGNAGCLSFFPSKNLGCCGDGGMVVTSDAAIAEKVGILRAHGCKKKYYHLVDGFNSRLDTLQAAVLRVKLRYLDQWTALRREKAVYYNTLLSRSRACIVPKEAPYAGHVFYAYTVRVPRRDELKEYLAAQGITTMIYYPVPLHLQDVYAHLGFKIGDFPVAEKLADEVLTLPLYPELTREAQEYIAGKISEFYGK
jgi:dTDP-4-amino-4,6-dideoxygalactose transaminase